MRSKSICEMKKSPRAAMKCVHVTSNFVRGEQESTSAERKSALATKKSVCALKISA